MPDSGMELDLTRLREPERMNPNRSLYEQGREDARTLILAALRAHGLHRWQPAPTGLELCTANEGTCKKWQHEHLDWLFDLLEATP